MRILLPFLLLISFQAFTQNGYVITRDTDSTFVGYVRRYSLNGQVGLEVWKTKKDKDPRRFAYDNVWEYAIKKDTFRVITNFKPFQETNTYFDWVDAKVVSRGKVNLYIIENYANPNRVSSYTGGGLVPLIIDLSVGNYSFMYLIEDESNYRGLPSKKTALVEVLKDYMPEKYLIKYAEKKKEISYLSLPDVISLYNSR